MSITTRSVLPMPMLRRGKVREVYAAGDTELLLVASDRVSAFDIVMNEPIPHKGAVLTQLSAWWFQRLGGIAPSHFITADAREIIARLPALAEYVEAMADRAMLVRRTFPVAFECVVRGYLAGSAWAEYREHGTLAGEPLPAGLVESAQLDPPIFSPATKAESGHDQNVPVSRLVEVLGQRLADRLQEASLALYRAGRDTAASRGIIVADTKFEFGAALDGSLLLIDEALTPDSSRFWPADRYEPGRSQPSLDKQPLRDWLAHERREGRWNGEAPPPTLPPEVIQDTTNRYLDVFRRLTGTDLKVET